MLGPKKINIFLRDDLCLCLCIWSKSFNFFRKHTFCWKTLNIGAWSQFLSNAFVMSKNMTSFLNLFCISFEMRLHNLKFHISVLLQPEPRPILNGTNQSYRRRPGDLTRAYGADPGVSLSSQGNRASFLAEQRGPFEQCSNWRNLLNIWIDDRATRENAPAGT